MTALEELRISSSALSDGDLTSLETHPRLRHLQIVDCNGLTDDGLAPIGRLKYLDTLIINTDLTDAGLAHLREMPMLRTLRLSAGSANQFTSEAIESFRRALPQCELEFSAN